MEETYVLVVDPTSIIEGTPLYLCSGREYIGFKDDVPDKCWECNCLSSINCKATEFCMGSSKQVFIKTNTGWSQE